MSIRADTLALDGWGTAGRPFLGRQGSYKTGSQPCNIPAKILGRLGFPLPRTLQAFTPSSLLPKGTSIPAQPNYLPSLGPHQGSAALSCMCHLNLCPAMLSLLCQSFLGMSVFMLQNVMCYVLGRCESKLAGNGLRGGFV